MTMISRIAQVKKIVKSLGLATMVCVLCAGCEDISGAVMEKAITSKTDGSPKRASFAAKFRKLKQDCPMEIDDYTTLEWVKMKGLNRVEFRYKVSESGRPIVNMNNWRFMDAAYIAKTAENPLAPSIVALDLGVEHVFKDTDGLQMYSVQVTKSDLKKYAKKVAIDEQRKLAEKKFAEAQNKVRAATLSGTSTGGGITITALGGNVPVQKAQVTNPVFGTRLPGGPVPTSSVSLSDTAELPSKIDASDRSKTNPAGIQTNPFGGSGTQSNPYAN